MIASRCQSPPPVLTPVRVLGSRCQLGVTHTTNTAKDGRTHEKGDCHPREREEKQELRQDPEIGPFYMLFTPSFGNQDEKHKC